MKVIVNQGKGVDRRAVNAAADALRRGEVIIYPTDTLYALGCDALDSRAIDSLCRIKGLNPDKNLLSVVCSDLSQASQYARIDNAAYRIVKGRIPGPYTFVLPAANNLPKVFKGRKSVGIRIPDCDFARALAEVLGHPVLTTSVSAPDTDTDAEELCSADSFALLYSGYKDITLAIDGGSGTTDGSTVVDITDSHSPEVIRQGLGPDDF